MHYGVIHKQDRKQMNNHNAGPKINSYVFLHPPHFLKTILASLSNRSFVFVRYRSQSFAELKERFFYQREQINIKF